MKSVIVLCCSILAAVLSFAQTPVISVDPQSLEQGLYTGDTSARVLTISNLGTGELSCQVTVEPTSPTGSPNNAVQLDGTNDYIYVYNDQSLQLSAQLTIEAWINFEEGGSGQPRLLFKGSQATNYDVFFDSTLATKRIGMMLDPVGTIISETVLTSGTWYHVAFTYDGTAMKLYINGQLDKSQPASGSITTSNYNLYIGKKYPTSAHYYKGMLDEVRIWNIPRSQTEIQHTMNHELSGQETGLVASWSFNESSGNYAIDATNYGNNGTLINGTQRVYSSAPIINWLDGDPASMTVEAGESFTLMAIFNAIGLDGGSYSGQVTIHSNDPENPQLVVPVELVVTPTANINLSVTRLDFGEVYVGASESLSFVVSNSGNDTLRVTSMTCPNADYDISPLTISIPPGGSDTIEVNYTPSTPEADDAVLTILSNDFISPSVTLQMTGTGVAPPVISVTPDSLSAVLYSGKSSTQIFTISNTGVSDLVWEINLQNIGFPPVTFTKENYADWTNPANQDRITPDVYITRANTQGIFNVKTESGYNASTSPQNTEWAYGYTKDLDPEDYQVWRVRSI